MDTWLNLELSIILWMQQFEGLAPFMRWFTDAGLHSGLWIVAIVVFLVDAKKGIVLAFLFCSSIYVTTIAKLLFATPRPHWISDGVIALTGSGSFGLPSGHVLESTCIWLGVAYLFPKPWIIWSVVALSLLMAMSRIYLGIHFIVDVFAGLCLAWLLARLLTSSEFRTAIDPSNVAFSVQHVLLLLGLMLSAALFVLFVASWRQSPFYESHVSLGWHSLDRAFRGISGIVGLILGLASSQKYTISLLRPGTGARIGLFVYVCLSYWCLSELARMLQVTLTGANNMAVDCARYLVVAGLVSFLGLQSMMDMQSSAQYGAPDKKLPHTE